MLVSTQQTTQHHNPEDSNFNISHHTNLKLQKMKQEFQKEIQQHLQEHV